MHTHNLAIETDCTWGTVENKATWVQSSQEEIEVVNM